MGLGGRDIRIYGNSDNTLPDAYEKYTEISVSHVENQVSDKQGCLAALCRRHRRVGGESTAALHCGRCQVGSRLSKILNYLNVSGESITQ